MKNAARLLVAAFTLLIAPAQAEPDFRALQEMIEKVKDAAQLPSGTAFAIVKGDRIIHEGYFGYADIEAGVKVDKQTVFYIASSTKPFFSLNALLLADKGKLDTQASLQSLFPDTEFQGFDATTITMRDLLVHTSGLDNPGLGWATAFHGVHDLDSRRRLVAMTIPAEESAHGEFDYTNLGYNILSVALDARGTPWQDQLREQVFKPLGMNRTSAYMSEAHRSGWQVARPYSLLSENRHQPLYLEKVDATMHAAGGMLSTTGDLARFLIAQMNEGRVDGKQVFPSRVIEKSQARQAVTDSAYGDFKRDGYAWGWYTGEYKGRRMLHHFGGFAGFHAHLSYIPEAQLGLVVLNNEDFVSARLTGLIADVAYGTLLGEAGVADKVTPRVNELLDLLAQADERIKAQRQAVASRPWLLSRPVTAYAGTYASAAQGAVRVEALENGKLAFTWGQLHAIADGYDKQDVVRIEPVPGSGELASFVVQNDTVRALIIDGIRFRKE